MTDAFALLGINLVLCAGLLASMRALQVTRLHPVWPKVVTALFFALLWVPLGAAQIPAVAYVRGITADLSVTLVALAVWQLSRFGLDWRAIAKRELLAVMASVAAAALFLYPMALGWGNWDAYRPGWGSWGMLLGLFAVCVVCGVNRLAVLPALVALSLLAWSFGLMESGNLWDYLLDPWLSVYSLGYVSRFVFIKCVRVAKAGARTLN